MAFFHHYHWGWHYPRWQNQRFADDDDRDAAAPAAAKPHEAELSVLQALTKLQPSKLRPFVPAMMEWIRDSTWPPALHAARILADPRMVPLQALEPLVLAILTAGQHSEKSSDAQAASQSGGGADVQWQESVLTLLVTRRRKELQQHSAAVMSAVANLAASSDDAGVQSAAQRIVDSLAADSAPKPLPRLPALPPTLLLHVLSAFLQSDRDAASVAQSCHELLANAKKYPAQVRLTMEQAVARAAPDESKEPFRLGVFHRVVAGGRDAENAAFASNLALLASSQSPSVVVRDLLLESNNYSHFAASLEGLSWPASLRSVRFDRTRHCSTYRAPLYPVTWPAGLTELVLPESVPEGSLGGGNLGSQKAGEGKEENDVVLPAVVDPWMTLPPSLRTLVLPDNESRPLAGMVLPSSLRSLVLPREWDHPVSLLPLLPPGLESFEFGRDFDQVLSDPSGSWKLPSNLEVLKLGQQFGSSMKDVAFPPGLRRLIFAQEGGFDDALFPFQALPSSLTELELGSSFASGFRGWTPSTTLTRFSMGKDKSKWALPGDQMVVPPSVRELYLPAIKDNMAGLEVPAGVTFLNASGCREDLAPLRFAAGSGLRTVVMDYNASPPRTLPFPPSLTRLELGCNYSDALLAGDLPETLKALSLGSCWDLPLSELVLPAGLESLEFSGRFSRSLKGYVWPAGLKRLCFRGNFSERMAEGDWNPPESLTELSLSSQWRQQHLGSLHLPQSLRILRFGRSIRSVDGMAELPAGLEELHFGIEGEGMCQFNSSIRELVLPPKLRLLSFAYCENFNPQSEEALPEPDAIPKTLTSILLRKVTATKRAVWDAIPLPPHCALQSLFPSGIKPPF